MINSGLSMLRSLYILAEQTESKPLAAVVNQVRLDVERGSSLSAALAKHPKAFNRLYVAMVRAGEAGGVLDSVLQRLADHDREAGRAAPQGEVGDDLPGRRVDPRAPARHRDAAVRHPDVPGHLRAARRQAAGADADPDQRLERRAQALVHRVRRRRSRRVSAFRKWINSEEGRKRWDAIKLKMPVFGELARKTALARFGRTLSALVRSGVPILESLDIVRETAGNWVVSEAVRDTAAAGEAGRAALEAARGAPGVPADGRADDGRR